ncbi:short chain dehydrogenase reductase family [Colletotrichum karsti]|uniref:Short chain dehydrogenase reductase family n=1 Tax=Colletotrichum karsti TaxID=1095194 RepID=A0A9P6LJM5_9PEZI|nr:short chain dehydrogenase reductase family [Colletotrichum karsti]KAF9874712.1 short chain dehydrogenase reductase family [Colletotrichum karsti]
MPPVAVSDFELPAEQTQPKPEAKDPLASSVPTPQLFSLANKTILITGGGRGLGITFALAVLEAGGHAACLDILPEPSAVEWAHLTKLAKANGLSVTYHKCDITDEAATEKVFNEIADAADERGAPFWGAVACAGIQQKIPALEYPVADFERIQKVNVVGVFVTAKQAARVLVGRKSKGSILLISSMSGEIANRGLTCSAYNTSKAAVQQMCRSVAQEWGQYGIRVNTLSPGYIRTAMTDQLLQAEPDVEKTWMMGALLQRLGTPEDFKAPAVFLLSEGSGFMTGADLRVDGGHCASA